jgi:hypothetical protein
MVSEDQAIQGQIKECLMNNRLERTWKQSLRISRYYAGRCLEGLSKTA